MLPMSSPDVQPGAVETQQMRVIAPVGVSFPGRAMDWRRSHCASQANVRLRLRISYSLGGRQIQDQVDFAGFPPGLTGNAS